MKGQDGSDQREWAAEGERNIVARARANYVLRTGVVRSEAVLRTGVSWVVVQTGPGQPDAIGAFSPGDGLFPAGYESEGGRERPPW